jgi:hypothetical protein
MQSSNSSLNATSNFRQSAGKKLPIQQKKGDPDLITFEAGEVLRRAKKNGDLFAAVLTLKQRLSNISMITANLPVRQSGPSSCPTTAAGKTSRCNNRGTRSVGGEVCSIPLGDEVRSRIWPVALEWSRRAKRVRLPFGTESQFSFLFLLAARRVGAKGRRESREIAGLRLFPPGPKLTWPRRGARSG